MLKFAILCLVAAILGMLLYVFLVYGQIPGFVDERLGNWEKLPVEPGAWGIDESHPDTALAKARNEIRELRYVAVPSTLLKKERYLLQVRYRSSEGDILKVEDEILYQRKRVKTESTL